MSLERIETLQGVGEVYNRSERLASVDYAIDVVQEIVGAAAAAGASPIRGRKSAHGEIRTDSATMQQLFRKRALTLRLEDGREVDFFLEDAHGKLVCSGPVSELIHR
jgi:hypothetical protein